MSTKVAAGQPGRRRRAGVGLPGGSAPNLYLALMALFAAVVGVWAAPTGPSGTHKSAQAGSGPSARPRLWASLLALRPQLRHATVLYYRQYMPTFKLAQRWTRTRTANGLWAGLHLPVASSATHFGPLVGRLYWYGHLARDARQGSRGGGAQTRHIAALGVGTAGMASSGWTLGDGLRREASLAPVAGLLGLAGSTSSPGAHRPGPCQPLSAERNCGTVELGHEAGAGLAGTSTTTSTHPKGQQALPWSSPGAKARRAQLERALLGCRARLTSSAGRPLAPMPDGGVPWGRQGWPGAQVLPVVAAPSYLISELGPAGHVCARASIAGPTASSAPTQASTVDRPSTSVATTAPAARFEGEEALPPQVANGRYWNRASVLAGKVAGEPMAIAWDFACIRWHESGDRYSTDTGNGHFGAYQFDLPTWASVGGTGLPSRASPHKQDRLAYELYRRRGWEPWQTAPLCGL